MGRTICLLGADVPLEAIAFLGAVAIFLVLLVIFFLYLNKKLCFSHCGGFPCIDNPTKSASAGDTLGSDKQPIVERKKRKLKYGSAYAYEDQDTSSDSDDEVLRRYQQSIQRVPSQKSLQSGRSQRSAATEGKASQRSAGVGRRQDHVGSMERGSAGVADVDSTRGADSASFKASTPAISSRGGQARSSPPQGDPAASTRNGTYENEGYQRDTSPPAASPTSTERALSAYGETASASISIDHDEHLFDVSDLQDREPVLISKCGHLDVTFDYDSDRKRMTVTVHTAREIPSKDRGGANNTQIRLLLLPTKKSKFKTKIKQGENPEFQETFQFKISNEEVGNMGIRFRLYGCERMRRERMIGECVVSFASLSVDSPTTHALTLEPRSNLSHGDSKADVSSLSRSDSASSTQSMQHGGMPELLVGLAYNGTTGRLSVEVIKGSNFKNMAMNRAPDTYVKLTLMSPNGQEIARSKTSVRRGQPNPLYKETFMYQVALFQLPDVTLMISVYNKRSMKRKDMIGWFALGYSSSGEEEVSHWNDMRENKGEQVCRWHVLLEA